MKLKLFLKVLFSFFQCIIKRPSLEYAQKGGKNLIVECITSFS